MAAHKAPYFIQADYIRQAIHSCHEALLPFVTEPFIDGNGKSLLAIDIEIRWQPLLGEQALQTTGFVALNFPFCGDLTKSELN